MSLTLLPGDAAQYKKIALLGALCLVLSLFEYMIPKPLPFLRTGIANLPVMIALYILPFKSILVLAAVKALGQALITGTLFSYIFLFSAAGIAASVLVMYALRRMFGQGQGALQIRRISFIGLGVAGAVVSNAAQLLLAWFFVFGSSVRYIVPPFLAAGIISGAALGVFCECFVRRSRWYAEMTLDRGDAE